MNDELKNEIINPCRYTKYKNRIKNSYKFTNCISDQTIKFMKKFCYWLLFFLHYIKISMEIKEFSIDLPDLNFIPLEFDDGTKSPDHFSSFGLPQGFHLLAEEYIKNIGVMKDYPAYLFTSGEPTTVKIGSEEYTINESDEIPEVIRYLYLIGSAAATFINPDSPLKVSEIELRGKYVGRANLRSTAPHYDSGVDGFMLVVSGNPNGKKISGTRVYDRNGCAFLNGEDALSYARRYDSIPHAFPKSRCASTTLANGLIGLANIKFFPHNAPENDGGRTYFARIILANQAR